MKLSKLASITVTSSAVTVYLFGVMAVGVLAQDVSLNVVGEEDVVVTQEDLELIKPGSTGGFGLVLERFVDDLKERFLNDPSTVIENAEKELAIIVGEAGEEEGYSQEALAKAQARYEEKLGKLEGLMANLSDTQKEVMLQRIAKHEAVLSNNFVYEANEASTNSVQSVLGNLEEWKERALDRFEDKKARVEGRIEERKEAIQNRLEAVHEKVENRLEVRNEVIEARKVKLEEFKVAREKKMEEVATRVEEKKEEVKQKVEEKKIEVGAKQVEKMGAYELKKAELEEMKAVSAEKHGGAMSNSDYIKVKGAMDYQPDGILEMVGWMMGGL